MVMCSNDPFVVTLMKCLDIYDKHVVWFELRGEVDEFVTLTMQYRPEPPKEVHLKELEKFRLEKISDGGIQKW